MDHVAKDANKVGVCRYVADDYRTWHFQSTRNPNVYHTVDLAAYDCSGQCSCEHFDFRIRPLLDRGVLKPHEERAKCRHIRRAERVLLYRVKKRLFNVTNNPNQNPK